MKQISLFSILGLLAQILSSNAFGASATITGQGGGPTPFIRQVDVTITPAQSLASVQFAISPMPGSATRPISATYTGEYLQSRGYLNTQTGALVLPVFGLYPNFANTVSLRFVFTDNSIQQNSVTITTPAWVSTCTEYNNPIVIQARTNSRSLSYDYFLLKNPCPSQAAVLMDTDGAVRWVDTAGFQTLSSIFFDNGIYIAATPPNSSQMTGIARMELDGTISFLHDYSNLGVTSTAHHNFDPGREGILVEVNTTSLSESVIIEVDPLGMPLHIWNLGSIISAAMIAGGDNPTQFVRPSTGCTFPIGCPDDWFHNNAAAYRRSDDSLIVSSREDFVIALDYDTNAIEWILGDPTKLWFQFASLRRFGLALGANTLPPVGQHAVSITHDDNLLLFDDGRNSTTLTPPGVERTYSAARKYHINIPQRVATEIWNFENGQTIFSPVCSSVYEDAPFNYLIDYAFITNLPNAPFAELLGLDSAGDKIFDYRYSAGGCSPWNAIPVHLESLVFATVDPVSVVSRKTQGRQGTFDIPLSNVECRRGGATGSYQVVFAFPKPVTVSAAEVQGSAGSQAETVGPPIVSGNEVAVNLTNVVNPDSLIITLFGVSDGINLSTASVRMNVLVGDINGDGVVNQRDLRFVGKRRSRTVNRSNFRADVTANGVINKGDRSLITANLGRTVGP